MGRDSSIADGSQATAAIEAVCQEFRQALLSGEVAACGSSTFDFESWLARVDPPLRPRLAHHLTHLQFQHLSAIGETSDLMSTNLDFSLAQPMIHAGHSHLVSNLSEHDASHQVVFNCATLSRLPHEAKVALASQIQRREFAPGELLIQQGQPGPGLHLLQSGRVEVIDSASGQSTRIDFDGPGSVLGEMSLLTGQLCSADVVAVLPVVALVLPVEAFESLRCEFPELEIALSQLVSDRLGQRPHDALCGKTLGGYRLVHCISRGAMGVVYEAVDERDGQRRALKMLRHRFISNERALSRFDFEVNLLSRLRHENIVRTHGHFLAYRTRFLILDLCDGADLKRMQIRHRKLCEATVRSVLGQIAAGLKYAHQQGALHLDLKPANILVDNRGNVSITDFGLGRLIRSDGCVDSIAGTPSYMSPEQFKGVDIGPACDWYSLACLAYELLSGHLLFAEEDLAMMFNRKHYLASDIWPAMDISDELRGILHAALEPMVEYRHLDLDLLATWAQPAPELAVAPPE